MFVVVYCVTARCYLVLWVVVGFLLWFVGWCCVLFAFLLRVCYVKLVVGGVCRCGSFVGVSCCMFVSCCACARCLLFVVCCCSSVVVCVCVACCCFVFVVCLSFVVDCRVLFVV